MRDPRAAFWAVPVAMAAGLLACRRDAPPPSPAPAVLVSPAPARPPADELRLPRRPGSLRFAVIGDSGRGHPPQYEVSGQMQAFRQTFDYSFVLMLGDNVYDGGTRQDYVDKFEKPYAPLLQAGVKFYAVIGNHDDPMQHLYAPFNTGGKRYYTFQPERSTLARVAGHSVRFFMLDTENLDDTQLHWLEAELAASRSDWKIAVCHRPLYTSGRYERPARRFRQLLEPLFRRHGVDVVFAGHEHFYERTHPQHGITYFVSGAAGSLRKGDIRRTDLTAAGYDQDYSFMLVEIAGDELFFQSITRTGATIDAGVIRRPS